jgi:pimeloyl-ACP methyl ester carboxylesterase
MRAWLTGSVLSIALLALQDPSPHSIRFVAVDKDVSLEVLDWGGAGRPVVLLAGGGNTAHVFDEFAPKLTAHWHAYGITRRGFGASGFATPTRAVERLRDDVLAVIDALGIQRPVLVGHSIAGAELSAVATSVPNRIAGLVYLEAAYPYAFAEEKGPTMEEFQQARGPRAPTPGAADLASFGRLQKWDTEVWGFRRPEGELRQAWEAAADGRPAKERQFLGAPMFTEILTSAKRYTAIPVPALAIFAIPHLPDAWISKSKDAMVREAGEAYYKTVDALTERQAKALEDRVPTAHVVRLRGAHHIFLSNEGEVLREMSAFLSSLD